VLFAAIEPVRKWILQRSEMARSLERRTDPYAELPMNTERKHLEGQVVLVGLWPRRQADRQRAGSARHSLRGSRTES